MLRHELFTWYRSCKNVSITRVNDLKVKMLGEPSKPVLKTKAAETYGLLLFCQYALDKYKVSIPGLAGDLPQENAGPGEGFARANAGADPGQSCVVLP